MTRWYEDDTSTRLGQPADPGLVVQAFSAVIHAVSQDAVLSMSEAATSWLTSAPTRTEVLRGRQSWESRQGDLTLRCSIAHGRLVRHPWKGFNSYAHLLFTPNPLSSVGRKIKLLEGSFELCHVLLLLSLCLTAISPIDPLVEPQ